MTDPKFNFSGPGAGGGGFQKGDHLGCLVCFVGAEPVSRVGTSGEYNAAKCDVVVCSTHHEAWRTCDVSGAALAPRILSATGEIVAGRLIQGVAKEGRSAPFLLEDPTPDDIDELDKVFTEFAVKMPSSGEIVFDVEVFNVGKRQVDPPGPI